MQKLLFSVIIPTLNEEHYIPRLLLDLSRQQSKNFEAIVVDGKSEDKTKKVVLEFAEKLPLQFIQGGKRNLSYQRNLGGKIARGKFLIFLDADVRVFPTFTTRLEAVIKSKKRHGLFLLPSLVSDENSPKNKLMFKFVNTIVEMSQSIGKPIPAAGAMFIEKNFFHLIGGFNERLFMSEDHDILLRARAWGVIAKFLKDVRVVFSLRRMRKEGIVTLFSKYLNSTTQMLIRGKVKEGSFSYKMGGQEFTVIKAGKF